MGLRPSGISCDHGYPLDGKRRSPSISWDKYAFGVALVLTQSKGTRADTLSRDRNLSVVGGGEGGGGERPSWEGVVVRIGQRQH